MKNNDPVKKELFTYDVEKIAKRIRTLRISAHYTQEGLANELGVERSYIGHVESGKHGCSNEILAHIALLFDVSLDYLVYGKERGNSRIKKALVAIVHEITLLVDSL